MVMTHQAFGPLVGVPRLLELLADYSLPATFFVPGLTAERYPGTIERIAEAGHEIGHHSYSHRSAVDLSEAEERADFERALAALDRVGVEPSGHRAALWEASWRTAALVAEHGLALRLEPDGRGPSLPPGHRARHDRRAAAALGAGRLGAVRLPAEARRSARVIESPLKVLEMWKAELDAMRRHRCLFMLTCHPFLSGRAARVEALRALIEHALDAGDVEFADGRTVAERALKTPRSTSASCGPVTWIGTSIPSR